MPVPDISIEADDFEEVHRRVVAAGCSIEFGPAVEPWGVERFYVRDPFGRLLNILARARMDQGAVRFPPNAGLNVDTIDAALIVLDHAAQRNWSCRKMDRIRVDLLERLRMRLIAD